MRCSSSGKHWDCGAAALMTDRGLAVSPWSCLSKLRDLQLGPLDVVRRAGCLLHSASIQVHSCGCCRCFGWTSATEVLKGSEFQADRPGLPAGGFCITPGSGQPPRPAAAARDRPAWTQAEAAATSLKQYCQICGELCQTVVTSCTRSGQPVWLLGQHVMHAQNKHTELHLSASFPSDFAGCSCVA